MTPTLGAPSVVAAMCRDAPDWHSFFGHTCTDYSAFDWCRGGRLYNASAGGTELGAPEHACCACGGRSGSSGPGGDVEGDSKVRQAVFFATHEFDDTDVRLVRHYVAELTATKGSHARLFVLLFRTEAAPPLSASELASWRERGTRCGADVFLWSEAGLRRLFPKLSNALNTSHRPMRTPRKVSKYLFFHASLLLWHATFGARYPRVEHYWRIEPDVLFAGPLSQLLELAAGSRADVLVPHVETQLQTPTWPHWWRNEAVLRGVPSSQRLMSLVPIGRYSRRFLHGPMARRWESGQVGYEEITLPTTCAMANGSMVDGVIGSYAPDGAASCTVESMHVNAKIHSAKRVVYRPVWECAPLVAARVQRTRELWHPIKNRTCLVAWLDQ